jgi:hypothetical protein
MVTAAVAKSVDVLSVRKEVRDFVQAAEALLSPVALTSELTADECDLIKEYVMMLSNTRQPWSKGLPIKYT